VQEAATSPQNEEKWTRSSIRNGNNRSVLIIGQNSPLCASFSSRKKIWVALCLKLQNKRFLLAVFKVNNLLLVLIVFSGLAAWSENCDDTALCQLYRCFVSQSSRFCLHNTLCCFSTSAYCCYCLFHYRLCPETFGYTLVRTLPVFSCESLLLEKLYYEFVIQLNRKRKRSLTCFL
jgi:hypothetical protein